MTNPTLGWDLDRDVGEVLEYQFMVNALLAGSIVAVMAGLLGWFMVLRREAFAGHTLSLMAFPGAAAAALIGIAAAWGYFGFCVAGALAIGGLPRLGRRSGGDQSATIGAVQALSLALGFLFVSLYSGILPDLESLLFGTFVGISEQQVVVLLAVAAGTLAALTALARPLLFASVDPDVAGARGLPVHALSTGFLVLLGLAVAATSQITGVLLVFALLVMPAASAQLLTARPLFGLALTVALGLLIVWLGLGIAYFSVYPAGFFITTIAFSMYVLARVAARLQAARTRAPGDAHAPGGSAEGVIA